MTRNAAAAASSRELRSRLCALSVVIALVPLGFILFFVVTRGIGALNWDFFTQHAEAGRRNRRRHGQRHRRHVDAVGPRRAVRHSRRHHQRHLHVGVRRHRFASAVRFAADTLNGVPSIVIGVFVYGIVVLPFEQFSMIAGGVALGVMMIPIIARTTEELLRLVPHDAARRGAGTGRHAGTRAFRWCCRRRCRASSPASCSRSRASPAKRRRCCSRRSTTDSGNRTSQPTASLTVQIFTYASSPYEDWHRQAWAGALVLVSIVLICSILAR